MLLDGHQGCWCTIWVTGGVSTLLVSWTSGYRPSSNHVAFLSWKAKKLTLRNLTHYFPQTVPTDDARKSIGSNASGYGDGFLVLKRKERTIKGNWCNPTKDPPTVKLIFSLEHKEGKILNGGTYLG